MNMSIDEVYENLCTKDSRSPYFFVWDDEVVIPRNDCACDNCFYGRDKLALVILELVGVDQNVSHIP